jgi:hypothetical protein
MGRQQKKKEKGKRYEYLGSEDMQRNRRCGE